MLQWKSVYYEEIHRQAKYIKGINSTKKSFYEKLTVA
jgi:hypothetical protein